MDYQITVPRYTSKAGKRIFVPLNNLNPFKNVPKVAKDRTQPIVIKNPRTENDQFVFHIPEGYSIESIPEKEINLETEFGQYKVNIEVSDEQIIYNRILKINPIELPAERYDSFRNFYKEIGKADAMKIVLVKKS